MKRATLFDILAFAAILASTATAPAQVPGNQMNFDGIDDRVHVPHHPSLSLSSDFTVEAWINIPASQNGGSKSGIVKKGINENAENANYSLKLDNSNNHVQLTIGEYGGPGWQYAYSPQPFPANQWSHLAGVRSNSSLELYVDGSLVTSVTRTVQQDINTGPLVIGSMNNSFPGHHLTGSIDEVRLWDVARTAQEIFSTHNCTIDPSTPHLVGYWNFDEASNDQNVLDSSANANHGTLGLSLQVEPEDPLRSISTLEIGPYGYPYGLNAGFFNTLNVAWSPNATGPAFLGTIVVAGGAPGAAGLACVSIAPAQISLGNHAVLIDVSPGSWFAIPVTFGSAGLATLPVSLQAPSLAGSNLYLQALVDLGGPIFLSHGHELFFCP